MKKKNIITILTIILSLNSYAQLSAVDYKSKEFAAFKASKTYLVESGDEKFDSELQQAIKDLWNVTPTEVISSAKFETKLTDPSASFILLLKITGDKTYHYLALMNGGEKKLSNYRYSDMIAYCPINFYKNENKMYNCSYRIRNMVQSMIQTIEIVQKNDINGNSLKIAKGLQEHYNEKAKNIKNRTLLFTQESLGDKLTKADIAGLYPYKFEMCSIEKLEQVIKEKNKDYYYFQPTITLNKSMWVVDPSNGEILYFNYKMGGLDIKKDNIEDMVKIMKGKK